MHARIIHVIIPPARDDNNNFENVFCLLGANPAIVPNIIPVVGKFENPQSAKVITDSVRSDNHLTFPSQSQRGNPSRRWLIILLKD